MKTIVEALKDLYVAFGGDVADVVNCNTSVEVLNSISSMFEGEADAVLNPEAIENITAIADNISGGGSSAPTELIEIQVKVSSGSVRILAHGFKEDMNPTVRTIEVGKPFTFYFPKEYAQQGLYAVRLNDGPNYVPLATFTDGNGNQIYGANFIYDVSKVEGALFVNYLIDKVIVTLSPQ